LRIDEGDCAICVSGDGKVTPESLRLYSGADLVVQECQWATRTSYDHSCVADVRPLIVQANVKRIALVHRSGGDEAAIAERSRELLGERGWLPIAGESFQLS
jgi:ribonuclease BN (tRNA processing enzyme)